MNILSKAVIILFIHVQCCWLDVVDLQEVLCNILMQEKAWEQQIEEALVDAGMETEGKKEPAQLIRKMSEKIKKKKDKIANSKIRYVVGIILLLIVVRVEEVSHWH